MKTKDSFKRQIDGQKLRADIKRTGIRENAMSTAIGANLAYVSNAIGRGSIGVDYLSKICALTGTAPEDYYVDEQEKRQEPSLEQYAEALQEVITFLSQINARLKMVTDCLPGLSDQMAKVVERQQAETEKVTQIASEITSIKSNAQRHYEVEKTQLDKIAVSAQGIKQCL